MTLPGEYILPGDFVFPEGIAVEESTGDLYVSSFATGAVYRGTLDSSEMEVFLPPGTDDRTNALGLSLDGRGNLFVCGASTGYVFVYNTATRQLVRRFHNGLPRSQDPAHPTTYLNDVATAPGGDTFVTDSIVPVLYRISADAVAGASEENLLEPWLPLTGTPIVYQYSQDFVGNLNLNGIVATPDGRYLLVIQTNTGKVFRIEIATREIQQVDGVLAHAGDGIALEGQTLYAVHMGLTPVERFLLADDFLSGTPAPITNQPTLKAPTTCAVADGHLLVVNSQFDRLFFGGGKGELPFSISVVDVRQ